MLLNGTAVVECAVIQVSTLQNAVERLVEVSPTPGTLLPIGEHQLLPASSTDAKRWNSLSVATQQLTRKHVSHGSESGGRGERVLRGRLLVQSFWFLQLLLTWRALPCFCLWKILLLLLWENFWFLYIFLINYLDCLIKGQVILRVGHGVSPGHSHNDVALYILGRQCQTVLSAPLTLHLTLLLRHFKSFHIYLFVAFRSRLKIKLLWLHSQGGLEPGTLP